MSIYKHTPGPWKVEKEESDPGFEKFNIVKHGTVTDDKGIVKPYFNHLAQVFDDEINADADAQLIAAAPEMLVSLEQLIAMDDFHDFGSRLEGESKLLWRNAINDAKRVVNEAIGTTESLGDDPHNARNLADQEGGSNE